MPFRIAIVATPSIHYSRSQIVSSFASKSWTRQRIGFAVIQKQLNEWPRNGWDSESFCGIYKHEAAQSMVIFLVHMSRKANEVHVYFCRRSSCAKVPTVLQELSFRAAEPPGLRSWAWRRKKNRPRSPKPCQRWLIESPRCARLAERLWKRLLTRF